MNKDVLDAATKERIAALERELAELRERVRWREIYAQLPNEELYNRLQSQADEGERRLADARARAEEADKKYVEALDAVNYWSEELAWRREQLSRFLDEQVQTMREETGAQNKHDGRWMHRPVTLADLARIGGGWCDEREGDGDDE